LKNSENPILFKESIENLTQHEYIGGKSFYTSMPPPLENIDDKANFEGVVMLQWT
jgi:hypothetical protein